jgi:hypothetical protein
MFLRFVKGAYVAKDETGKERRAVALQVFERQAAALVNAFINRDERSFLCNDKKDLAAPQSIFATQFFAMALDAWDRAMQGSCDGDPKKPLIHFSHQGEFTRDKIDSKECFVLSMNDSAKSTSVSYTVDIMASALFQDIDQNRIKVLATMEYNPIERDGKARLAQRDMCATNTISLHRRPCIGIDIVGGNEVSKWNITAMAYFGAVPLDGVCFECSEMYRGQGLQAIFDVAVGIHEAAQGWSDDDTENEYRLGPVVAKHGNDKVYKAYYNAQFRKPNLSVVQEFFDDAATCWESQCGKVAILEMKYRDSEWANLDVSSKVFVQILNTLGKIHTKGKVHGDIRLANLLHSDMEGFLVDYDFVGRDSYPQGLQLLGSDGKRHPDVAEAIEAASIHTLEMKPKHDIYSTGSIMALFSCVNEANEESWQSIINACQSGNFLADEIVKKIPEESFFVRLKTGVLSKLF